MVFPTFIIKVKAEQWGRKMNADKGISSDRQNRTVPTQLPYPADAPEGASRALRALSAPTRVVTLRYLLDHDGATPAEIVAGTNATAIHPALLELEHLGFVTGDLAPGLRRGKSVRYTLDRAELARCLAELNAWMLPPTN
jgi:DNA-binding transcriptional ArsR family regulator